MVDVRSIRHPHRAPTLLHVSPAQPQVHYSGKPTAKPWHRVLDPRWKDFWPSRSTLAGWVDGPLGEGLMADGLANGL